MKQFINRKKEIDKLSRLWLQDNSQLVVIHGKRRVGKTELIKQFLKNYQGIYYLADKRSHKDQLVEFARVVGNFFQDDYIVRQGFSDWIEAFLYLKEKSKGRKFAVAIDEYPYLVESDSSVSTVFQKIWDEYIKDSGIYLILCGSSMSMMESELISYKAPLYGRLTANLLIEPMNYKASRKFFPEMGFEKFVSFYTVTGGMPAYMEQFSQFTDLEKALEEFCWDKQGLYYDEVNIALKQELRKPNNYFAILKAISLGSTRVSEIASKTGLDVQLVNKYLDTLIRLQFVRREVPVTEDKPHKSRKGIYVLTENFVMFWFQYIYSFKSDIEIGNLSQVKKKFYRDFNLLESIVYEQIAREHVLLHQDRFFHFERFGRFWNSKVEIDGVGFNHEEKKVLFMEAKWSDSRLRDRELRRLFAKAESVNGFDGYERFYLFYNKSGFTEELVDRAKDGENIFLVNKDKFIKLKKI